MVSRWIESVRGLEVKITGDFRLTPLRMTQPAVEELLLSRGAIVVADIRTTTDVLVRADSPQWKYRTYGAREAELARIQAGGRDVGVLDVEDLLALLEGFGVWARDPESAPLEAKPVGAPYRPAVPTAQDGSLVLVDRDPAVLERGLRGHAETQNSLASFVAQYGLAPLSPVGVAIQFDLAWADTHELWVAEVKSLTAQNQAVQMRLGLGQVLEYGWRLRHRHDRPVRTVLAVESRPDDANWVNICGDAGVLLVWPPDFAALANVIG